MDKVDSRQRDANCFDFLRLFAATCVLISHSVEHLRVQFFWLVQGSPWSYWFYDGVPLFFILSGFLIYRSYAKCVDRGLPTSLYFVNRYLRIAPAIYAYSILTTILLLVVGAISIAALHSREFWQWTILNFLVIPVTSPHLFKSFGTGYINGSLWTITAEVSFYLAIPLFFLIQRRFGFKVLVGVLAAIAVSGLMLQDYLQQPHGSAIAATAQKIIVISCLPYMTYFGLGIFWSRTWPRVYKSAGLAAACVVVYSAIRIFHIFGLSVNSLNPVYHLAWALPLSYAVLWVGHYGPSVFGRITRRIGDLSYGVYIWHMVMVNLVLFLGLKEKLSSVPAGPQLFVVITTFTLATLSWRFIEKPALSLKPYTSRPHAAEDLGIQPATDQGTSLLPTGAV